MAVHPLDHPRAYTHRLPTRRWRLLMLAGRLASDLAGRAQTMGRPLRARLGYAGGVTMGSWGIGVQFGLGWALMLGGLVTAVSFLLLYPVEGQ